MTFQAVAVLTVRTEFLQRMASRPEPISPITPPLLPPVLPFDPITSPLLPPVLPPDGLPIDRGLNPLPPESTPEPTYLESQGQRTIELWFTAESVGTNTPQVLYFEGNQSEGFTILVVNGQLRVGAWPNAGTSIIEDIDRGSQYHAVLTFDNGVLTAYLNGEQVGQQTGEEDITRIPFPINHRNLPAFDDVVMDDIALSAEEVATRYSDSVGAIAHWSLSETDANLAHNEGSLGNVVYSPFVGNPSLEAIAVDAEGDGAVRFDGIDDGLKISNHADINGSEKSRYSIELWFQADTVEGRQVLYEQGGAYNGFNLYLDGDQLNLGAWAGSQGEWLSQTVEAGRRYHAVLTFDHGVLTGYVNGQQMGQANTPFTVMPTHYGGIGIGYRNNDTRFSNTVFAAGEGDHFAGTIDDVSLYQVTLTPNRVATLYSEAVLPIAQWSLAEADGTKADNRGTLASAVDATYTGGTTLGAVALTADGGGAADFDGFNDGVALPNHTAINTSNHTQRTIELWFNADDLDGTQIIYEEGGGSNGMNVFIDGGQLKMGAWAGGKSQWLDAAVEANKTYQVTLVFDNGLLTSYLNGQQVGQANTGFTVLPAHGNAVGIGQARGNTRLAHSVHSQFGQGLFFNGTIDDVALYNDALSTGAISRRYASQTRHNEVLNGTSAADTLSGDLGDDTITGGAGDDTLAGNEGYDQLTGGAGADLFFLDRNDGTVDTILDFDPTEDKLVIAPTFGATSASDLAFDGATGHLSVKGNVIAILPGVSTLDVTDSSILIQQSLGIDEAAAVGDVVGSVAIANPATSNAYQIVSVDTGHSFSIDAQGHIFNQENLDYETTPSHTVQVQVTNSSGQTYLKEVLIGVEDINEAPDLVINGQSTVAPETTPINRWSLDERAFDGVDDGIRVANHSEINLSSKTQKTIELRFNADSLDGRQVLYEQGGRFNGFNLYLDNNQLKLGAWAGRQGKWLSQEVETGRNYHVILTFDQGVLSGYVNGQSIGQVETGFTTMPAHVGGIGIGYMNNDTLFSNTSGAAGHGHHFEGTIDDVTLYNAALSAVDVSRHYYQTDTLLNASVSERAMAGDVVADLDTVDPEGDRTLFRIVGGNEDDIFTINSTTGVVTVANAEALDYETQTEHTLFVAGIDSAGLMNVAQLAIAVGDENEAPTIGNQIIHVHEPGSQTALGDIIGQVQGLDPNNDQLTYSIVDYGADNPWGQALKVNPTTGELYLDYATVIDQDWQELTLLANQVTYQAYGDTTQNIVVQVSDGEFTDTATVSLQRPKYLGFFEKTGSDNPFNHYNNTYAGSAIQTKPTFVDIDGDGDLDAFMGVQFAASGSTASQAYLKFYQNDGEGNLTDTSLHGTSYNLLTTSGKWLRGGIFDLGSSDPSVAFGDVDSDGDVDLLIAMRDGIRYFKNDNNAFRQQSAANNPFSDIKFEGKKPTIALGDIDNDGAVELVVGRDNKKNNSTDPGKLYVYDRPRTELGNGLGWYTRPSNDFKLVSSRQLGKGSGEREPSPTLVDVNYDGTLDIVMGANDGTLRYYTGDGSNNINNFAQQQSGNNLFQFVDVSKDATPAIGDLNGDGYLDMAVGSGEGDGTISYFANPPSSGSIVFGLNEKNITEGSGNFSKSIDFGGFNQDLTKSTKFGNNDFSVKVFGGAKFALGLEAGFEFTPGKVSASLPFNLLVEAPEKVSAGANIDLGTTTQLAPNASFTTTTPFIKADVDFDFEFYLGGGIEVDYGVGKAKFDLAEQLGTNVNYSLDQSWDSRDASFSYTNQNTYETANPETDEKKLEKPPEKSDKYDEYQKEGSYDVASFDFKAPDLDITGKYSDGTSLKGSKTSTVLNTTLLLDDIIAGLLEASPEPTMQKIGKYWQEEKSLGPVDVEWNIFDLGLGGEVNVRAKHDLTFDKVTPTLYVENGTGGWQQSNGSYDSLTGEFNGVATNDLDKDGKFEYRIGYELEGAKFKSDYDLVLGDITLDLGLLEGKAKVDLGFLKEKIKFSALSTKIKLGNANVSIPVFETTRSLSSSDFGEAYHYGSIDIA